MKFFEFDSPVEFATELIAGCFFAPTDPFLALFVVFIVHLFNK